MEDGDTKAGLDWCKRGREVTVDQRRRQYPPKPTGNGDEAGTRALELRLKRGGTIAWYGAGDNKEDAGVITVSWVHSIPMCIGPFNRCQQVDPADGTRGRHRLHESTATELDEDHVLHVGHHHLGVEINIHGIGRPGPLDDAAAVPVGEERGNCSLAV